MESTERLGPDQRMRRQKTFKQLAEKGVFSRGEFFYLWVAKRGDVGQAVTKPKPMLGIVVSRTTDARAVGRNVWKRRVRAIFRKAQGDLHPEAVCLVKVRPAKKRPSFSAMEEELVKLFKKAGAWA